MKGTNTRPKKIFIIGFNHSGTTILRTIIGHIKDVHEIIDETRTVPKNIEMKYKDKTILYKFPFVLQEFYEKEYKDIPKIFIIRNPLWVFSSLNKRHDYKIRNNSMSTFEEYERTCRLYTLAKEKNIPNIHLIRYEDMFDNNYEKLREILDTLNLDYTDEIFDNSKYLNQSHSQLKIVPEEKPRDKNHIEYRTYQINQPFMNNNDKNKIDLLPNQIHKIQNSRYIKKIYSDEELKIV